MILRLLLAAASIVLHAAAAELTIKSPRIATVSKVGDLDNRQEWVFPPAHHIALTSGDSLHADGPLRLPVELSGSDILRLSLQIVDKETGEGVQPHQVFLRFFDKATEEEGIIPLKVSTQGKVKFDLVKLSRSIIPFNSLIAA
jgi:oligosaccharyltransferase complex subunit delta (ribophorin II)